MSFFGLLLTVSAIASCALDARAEIPDALEPAYSEAVLHFNAKSYEETLKGLDTLIAKDGKVPEFLELKALTLKSMKKDADAARVYAALIEQRRKDGAKPKDLAPYYFEIGMLQYAAKRLPQAKVNFEYSVRNEFNAGIASMYLGLMAFQSNDWEGSDRHFNRVLASPGSDDLRPAAYFYLGQTGLKQGYAGGATYSFIQARDEANRILARDDIAEGAKQMATDIRDATQKALEPYDRSSWFGYLTALTGYDSNILAIPSDVSASDLPSGKGTLKQSLLVAFGYVTSSLSTIQLVPSYRGAINLNSNTLTKASEFASNTLSLYINRKPLQLTTYGLRLEGSYTFKKEVDSSGNGTFHAYSKSFTVAPYFRTELKRQLQLTAEFALSPTKYDSDPSTVASRRSGTEKSVSLTLANDTGRRWWNPTYGLSLSDNGTEGTEFKAQAISLELGDKMNLLEKVTFNASASFTYSRYSDRLPEARYDRQWAIQSSAAWTLDTRWTALASFDFMLNSSNLASTYSFSRFGVNLGVTYSL